MATLTDSGNDQQAYKRALEDVQKKFETLLRHLSTETANDLIELLKIRAQAVEESDVDDQTEATQAILEILFPDFLKTECRQSFFEDAPDVRQRLGRYRENVGDEIRKQRELLRMTQQQLADKAGIPQSHVSRLERGRHVPTFVTMEKIAAALDTTPSQIDPGLSD